MSDAVLVLRHDGAPVLTNAAYDHLFGAAVDFVPLDENGNPLPAEQWPQRRAIQGETFSMLFTLPAAVLPGADNESGRREYEANGQPICGEAGAPWQDAVVVIRDITERSLRRLQDEFMAMASHELRTPLTPLQGYLDMLIRSLAPDDERTRRYATQARAQVQRIRILVDDLLDVGRLQSAKLTLKLAPIDLIAPLTRAVEGARLTATGQTIRLDAPNDAVTIAGDAARLEQVFLNLLTNAIKYAPDSETIDVRLRRVPAAPDAAVESMDGLHEAGAAGTDAPAVELAEIQVQDYGPGILADALPNIFARFYQSERNARKGGEDGLGLGLYIAREIVTAHGGTITADSSPGQGATFTVRLPLRGGE